MRLSTQVRPLTSRLRQRRLPGLLMVCSAGILAWYLWSTARRPRPTVCMIGNSENAQRSLKVFAQWGGAFPSAFYVWGEQPHTPGLAQSPDPAQLALIRLAGESLSFSDGLDHARKYVMAKHHCDYIFTHDDDLEFHLAPTLRRPGDDLTVNNGTAMASRLVDILAEYNPAIASFPWEVGDKMWETMATLKVAWEHHEVAPLTGFDNGMVLYHRDVLDFYFPFPPSGEGGFVGKWTLSAHYFMLFAGALFKENAIRINALKYVNTINLNNRDIPAELVTIEDGVATVPWTRHPYEWPLKESYVSFLASGLFNRSMPYGRYFDVNTVYTPSPRLEPGYPPTYVLSQLQTFYDVEHAALSKNVMLKSLPSDMVVSHSRPSYSIRIIMFTMNRLESFKRLWNSVQRADTIPVQIDIDIFVDYDDDATAADRRRFEMSLYGFVGSTPNTTLHLAKKRKGLKQSILEAWKPETNYEYAIMLEDDIEVSPLFLRYAKDMIDAYYIRDHADIRLFAISLYAPRYNEVLDDFVSVENAHQPWVHQQPQSWGAVFAPEPWRQFLMWQAEQEKYQTDPIIPDSATNRWNYLVSWKKYLFRYMLLKGAYLIYPNLPDGASLSTNHVESGTNHLNGAFRQSDKDLINSKYLVPLLQSSAHLPDGHFPTPPLDQLQVYSLKHNRLDHREVLMDEAASVTSFDRCTLIVSVTTHPGAVGSVLNHFARKRLVGQIIVEWRRGDNPAVPKAVDGVPITVVPLGARAPRIYPHQDLKYACIVSVRDSTQLFPSVAFTYAVALWKGALADRIIGFRHFARNHIVIDGEEGDGRSQTLYSPTPLNSANLWGGRPFASMVLTNMVIYHRKYLDEYFAPQRKALRDIVERHPECADLALNTLISLTSKTGPVVVDTLREELLLRTDAQLQPEFAGVGRSHCFAKMAAAGVVAPPSYTTSFFTPTADTVKFIPGRLHHRFQPEPLFRYPCRTDVYKRTGDCDFNTDKWLYRARTPTPPFWPMDDDDDEEDDV